MTTTDARPTPDLPDPSALIAGLADGTLAIGSLAGFEVAKVVNELMRRNAELEEANSLAVQMLAEPESVKVELAKTCGHIDIQHWAIGFLADSLADSLGDAPNCLEMEVGHSQAGALIVTIQRRHGKTPMELRTEAIAERDALLRHCVRRGQLARADYWFGMVKPDRLGGPDWEMFESEADAVAAVRRAVGLGETES